MSSIYERLLQWTSENFAKIDDKLMSSDGEARRRWANEADESLARLYSETCK